MRFYLAHNYAAKEWLKENIVPILEREGHIVTSRWLVLPERDHREAAERDLEDIERSDALILFAENHGPRPGRGKYFELGYAYAEPHGGERMKIFVVGKKKDCCFYELPGVRVFETFDQLYAEVFRSRPKKDDSGVEPTAYRISTRR